ncbi:MULTISPECIES: anti-sigma factor domain-containing protein [unclassified Paenibacillus]|uniref:anti-sigma factor domain-containing protein n=1 Tax=unclassified Paenibacillus TaxID=185978 RepID=UPI00363A5EA8
MSSGTDEAMCEWLEMYALDGLEEHEKVAFEYHLTHCALCRNQLIELKQVVNLLPLASDQAPIPEGMRDRVLGSILGKAAVDKSGTNAEAGVENETPGRLASQGRRSAPSAREAVKEVANSSELSRRAVQTERTARKSAYWRWVSVGLTAAVIGMGLYTYQLNNRLGALRMELLAANQEVAKAGTELAQATSKLISMNKPTEALKVNRIVSLSPAAESFVSKGLATIVIDAKGTHLIVQAEELPQIKQDEAFQVWLIKDNQPVNAGTFYPRDGKGALYYTFEPKEYDNVVITLEPDAHGEKPRGAIVLAAGLKS